MKAKEKNQKSPRLLDRMVMLVLCKALNKHEWAVSYNDNDTVHARLCTRCRKKQKYIGLSFGTTNRYYWMDEA